MKTFLKRMFLCVLTILSYQIQAQTLIGPSLIGEQEGDRFGRSVAMTTDGNIIALSATGHQEDSLIVGKVSVRAFVNGDWRPIGNDILGDQEESFFGGSIALSANGQRIAIGNSSYDINGQGNNGQVKVYDFNGTAWEQIGSSIDGMFNHQNYGMSVSLSADGNILALGTRVDANGSFSGQTQIYQLDNSEWTLLGEPINGEQSEFTGYSIKLDASGHRIAIGGPAFNAGDGVAKVYEFTAGNWVQLGSSIKGANYNDNLGYSVDLSADGNRFIVGTPEDDTAESNAGKAAVYEFKDGDWNLLGAEIFGKEAEELNGNAVAISKDGNRIAVSAYEKNTNGGTQSGAVQIYEWKNNSWEALGLSINGSEPQIILGISIALSADGSRIVTGAPGFYNSMKKGKTKVYYTNQFDFIHNITDCESYTTPSGETLTTSGIYLDTLDDDSVVAIFLNIPVLDASITFDYPSISAHANEALYQWLDCDANLDPIENATEQIFTPNSDGNYALQVTENGCLAVSDCIALDVVHTEEQAFAENLKVFPNPTSGPIQIQLNDQYKQVSIFIFNSLGQLVLERNFTQTALIPIQLPDSKGIYHIRLQNDTGISTTMNVLKN